jgi:AbrB family looped-hinge helix DNA binding protein
MEVLKMDQKGRIQLPKRVRKLLKLKPKEVFLVEIEGNEIRLSKPSKIDVENDNVLKDMVKRPLHLKGVKLTKGFLNSLEDEAWLS